MKSEITLYTDGACRGNPGPGGWGYILRHHPTGYIREDSGSDPNTTNNRMELMAVVMGLSALKRSVEVEVVSDSTYVLNGLKNWMQGWKANNWRTRDKKPVKNVDLWKTLDQLAQVHKLKFTHVRGHHGHPENERCDQLATQAADSCIKSES